MLNSPVFCTRHPLIAFALIGCLGIGLGSCRSTQASMRTAPVTADGSSVVSDGSAVEEEVSRWPERWGNDPDRRGVIIDLDRPWGAFRSVRLSRYSTMRSSEIEYNDAEILAGALGMESGFKFRAEGPGSFLFVPSLEPDEKVNPKLEPDMAFKFVTARRFGAKNEEDFVRLDRTWFTLSMPDDADDLLGTVVILPGMFGTPEPVVDGIALSLESKGWAVLRMMAHPSGFTAYKQVPVDLEVAETVGGIVAREYDQRAADCAYATKAALDHVLAAKPELADHPVALMGMSGGAMVLPTVYAYSPDSYDAGVLIAGGANSLLITAMSNYRAMIDAVRFDFDPRTEKLDEDGTREQLRALSKAYLAESKLDALYTAKEMHDIPVLMLHASRDKAVPAKRGDDLYKALGQPERWKYPVGHELIFAALPTQIGKINTWLLKALDLTEPAKPAPTELQEAP